MLPVSRFHGIARRMAMANNKALSGIPRGLLTLASLVLIAFALRAAQDILIPITVAVLLSFLLAPLASGLEKLRLGRIGSAIVVVCLALGVIIFVGAIVTTQMIDLAEKIPRYKDNILEKVESVKGSFAGGGLEEMTESIRQIGAEIAKEDETPTTDTLPAADVPASPAGPPRRVSPPPAPTPEATPTPEAAPAPDMLPADAPEPVPVRVVSERNPVELVLRALGPIAEPIGQAAIVVVLLAFMLIAREDLRDRFIRLVGEGRITVTTQALDDAARRVSRYLIAQLIVNTTYGIPVAVGLYFIGVPNAILFGVLAILLRYIPYVGPWIAGAMPIALSLAVFDGWTRPLLVVGLILALELFSNNIVEPLLYGASTGVSVVALLIAATFWTWLWGPMGLVLATPLTVCLVVLGRYVPQLEFFAIMLGDQPVLGPELKFFQRLVALDAEGAGRLAEDAIEDRQLADVFDSLIVPALAMVEREHHRGQIADDQREHIHRMLRELIDDLAEIKPWIEPEEVVEALEPPSAEARSEPKPRILCIPARSEADHIACQMLMHMLIGRGNAVAIAPVGALPGEIVSGLEQQAADVVCILAMPPLAEMHARHLMKRLHAKKPGLNRAVVVLASEPDSKKLKERIKTGPEDRAAVSLVEAAGHVKWFEAKTMIK